MSEVVSFAIIMALIGLAGVGALLSEEVEKVKIERHKRRERFLREHPNICQDEKGNLHKI